MQKNNNENYTIDFIINEMLEMIKDNIYTYLHSDVYFKELLEYVRRDLKLENTPSKDLEYITRNTLKDLIKVKCLFDYRRFIE